MQFTGKTTISKASLDMNGILFSSNTFKYYDGSLKKHKKEQICMQWMENNIHSCGITCCGINWKGEENLQNCHEISLCDGCKYFKIEFVLEKFCTFILPIRIRYIV